MIFIICLAVLGSMLIALDRNNISRALALTVFVIVTTCGVYHHIRGHAKLILKRTSFVLDGLPRLKLNDPQVYGLDRTPRTFSRLRKNERIIQVLEKLRPLRKYNENTFSLGCAYIDLLLKRSSKMTCAKPDLRYLVLLKSRALDTFQEFAVATTADKIERIQFSSCMKALDTVLYTEAIGPFARPQDLYPIAADTHLDPHLVHGVS